MEKFKLNAKFIAEYKDKQPPWGPLGLVTYTRTYSRKMDNGKQEQWTDTIQRVVEGCYAIQKDHCKKLGVEWDNEKAQKSSQEMFRRMWDMRFLPPGRGLWMMGTPSLERHAGGLFNCFAGDTEIITKTGTKKIKDVVGTTQTILNGNGGWQDAPINSFGEQRLWKMTLSRQGVEKTIFTTAAHRWFVKDRRAQGRTSFKEVLTKDLKPGVHTFKSMHGQGIKNVKPSPFGVAHGFTFGDGSTTADGAATCVHTFGDKDSALNKYFALCPSYQVSNGTRFTSLPDHYKNLPSITENKSYLLGWLMGYFAADGSCTELGQVSISSVSKANIEAVRDICVVLGIGTYSIQEDNRISNLTNRSHTMYRMTLQRQTLTEDFFLVQTHKTNFLNNKTEQSPKNWHVVSLEETDSIETVYCATVEGSSSFTLDGNLLTGNCAFRSTSTLHVDLAEPFCWAMEALMLGTGVGYDSKGEGLLIRSPRQSEDVFVVEDSREGWVEALRAVIFPFTGKGFLPASFDYSKVRGAGEPIKGFGGVSSGPGPLDSLLQSVKAILHSLEGKHLTVTAINDIFNLIGKCVVSGNVRRSALISLGNPSSDEFLNLKNPEINMERLMSHGWASNNSVFGEIGMSYDKIGEMAGKNGEPGIQWLENCKKFGRMKDQSDNKDYRVSGCNPCQPAWATVLTPEGIKTFGDIGIGSVIWSGKQWTKVVNKWSTGVKTVNKYVTRAGVFEGTENHRIFQNGERIEVGLADTIDTCQGPARSISIIPDIVMDGLMIGDGHRKIERNRTIALLDVGFKDQDYFTSEVSSLLHENYSKDTSYKVTTSVCPVTELLPKPEIVIPNRFMTGTPSQVASFLRGLYSANGSVVRNRVTLKTASEQLVKQTQMLLSSLGIRSYYTTNKPSDVEFSNGMYTCKKSYDLNISTDRNKFAETIGFLQNYKNEKLAQAIGSVGQSKYSHSSPKTSYEIVDVETVGEFEVFDITVDADEHSYWTGGLLVSNCAEQVLEDGEYCCLVEVFPAKHDSYKDYELTLKYAYLYAKTVTLLKTSSPKSNAIMQRNRRIGCSNSGIVQAIAKFGQREFFKMCDDGYTYLKELDRTYSEWFCIPRSVRMTTVKPSGTTSLLNGSTPGIHFPHSEFYIRRIRFQDNSPMLPTLKAAGYPIEKDSYSPNTMCVSFPVQESHFSRSKYDVSLWEQLELAANMQYFWSDNSVSITVTVKEQEKKDIKYALELYETRLKTVSFLPLEDHKYVQAPYETITEAQYNELVSKITPVQSFSDEDTHEVTEVFCTNDVCELVPKKNV